ncbi:MAG: hypothetical protein AAF090_13965 [Bacteroidota bacterium]
MRTIRFALYLTFLSLFFYACESDEEDTAPLDPDNVGFNVTVSGELSRNMQGTNAYYRFQQLPESSTTTHQLSIYLTDGDGYTVTAIIGVNGETTPSPGTYPALNLTGNGYNGDDPGTSTFLFGKDGGISHSSNLMGQGGVSISTTTNGLLSGTLETPLSPTANGTEDVLVTGTFTVEFRPQ